MLARWRPGHSCAPHDHGGAGGHVIPVEGTSPRERFSWDSPHWSSSSKLLGSKA